MHFSSRVLFLIDSCKALLIIYYVKRRYIKWKLLLLLLFLMEKKKDLNLWHVTTATCLCGKSRVVYF